MGAYGAIAAARKSRAFPPKKLRESKGIQSPWRRFGGGAPKVLPFDPPETQHSSARRFYHAGGWNHR